MAFSGNAICTSFKKELLMAAPGGMAWHDFTAGTGHTFKLALYSNAATLNAATTAYTATHEITGTGYSAGGIVLTAISPVTSGTVAFADFADATFSNATLTARGGLIYNTTAGGGSGTFNAVAVLDFGLDRSVAGQNFVITFPTADALNAIIRIN